MKKTAHTAHCTTTLGRRLWLHSIDDLSVLDPVAATRNLAGTGPLVATNTLPACIGVRFSNGDPIVDRVGNFLVLELVCREVHEPLQRRPPLVTVHVCDVETDPPSQGISWLRTGDVNTAGDVGGVRLHRSSLGLLVRDDAWRPLAASPFNFFALCSASPSPWTRMKNTGA